MHAPEIFCVFQTVILVAAALANLPLGNTFNAVTSRVLLPKMALSPRGTWMVRSADQVAIF